MELTFEIVDVPGWGYGYRVESSDGSFHVFQTVKPGVPGNVKMTRADAQSFAQALIDSLSAPSTAE